MFERFLDKQRLRGRAVESFGPNASGNVFFRTQSGNAASSSSTSRAIIDASVVPNTLLNLKHRGKWFAPMRQFVDRRGRDWSFEVQSEVRCKRHAIGCG